MKTGPTSLAHTTLLATNLQGVYQDLGLEPLVCNLDLDRHHPTMRVLTEATQASAASSLMALHQGMSLEEEMAQKASNETTRKRVRSDGEETPVRVRSEMRQSPSSNGASRQSPMEGAANSPCAEAEDNTPSESPRKGEPQADRLHQLLAAAPGNGNFSDEAGVHSAVSHPEVVVNRSPLDLVPSGKKGSAGKSSPHASVSEKDKNKGLRQFSLRVCRQVEAKTVTTYNEVADELVKEFRKEDRFACDEKNIRRRAYDALNVLTAMDIISKDKKHIQWRGFFHVSGEATPTANSVWTEKDRLLSQIHAKRKELRDKEAQLEDLMLQFIGLRQLLKRNEGKRREKGWTNKAGKLHRIYLPFVIVQTDKDNWIECQISEDKHIADVSCDKPFELHDDKETLNMMEMFVCAEEELRQHVSENLVDFIKRRRPDVIGRPHASSEESDAEAEEEGADAAPQAAGDSADG